jgi:hypothetical protein
LKSIFSLNLILVLATLSANHAFATQCIKVQGLKTITTEVFKCPDGSISFDQLDSSNYEGRCGQTAAVNSVYSYCNKTFFEPSKNLLFFADMTPGTRPDTMVAGLNTLMLHGSCETGQWKHYYSSNRWDFFKRLVYATKKVNNKLRPLPVLIKPSRSQSTLHWVTVVSVEGFDTKLEKKFNKEIIKIGFSYQNLLDLLRDPKFNPMLSKSCKVRYNQYGGSYTDTCERFADKASGVNDSWYTSAYGEYNYIRFVK